VSWAPATDAAVTRLEGAGHMLHHSHPDALFECSPIGAGTCQFQRRNDARA
jgi:pimeloyl-ACP methyl ester carboxylesterase